MEDKLKQVQMDVEDLKGSQPGRAHVIEARRVAKSQRKPMSRVAQVEAQLPSDFHAWSVEKRQVYLRQEKNVLDQLAVRLLSVWYNA